VGEKKTSVTQGLRRGGFRDQGRTGGRRREVDTKKRGRCCLCVCPTYLCRESGAMTSGVLNAIHLEKRGGEEGRKRQTGSVRLSKTGMRRGGGRGELILGFRIWRGAGAQLQCWSGNRRGKEEEVAFHDYDHKKSAGVGIYPASQMLKRRGRKSDCTPEEKGKKTPTHLL